MEEKRPTYQSLVRKFLDSEISESFNLNSTDVCILKEIAYYLDNSPTGYCCPKRETLSKQSQTKLFALRLRIRRLEKLKLITIKKVWKLYYYELSSIISARM
jgi:hypothetical protein